ncbi:30S ribosomal protein S8 [Candidatus Saccharibacteria bacterium]|jgi:ribosomal protein S8|nr:30S ribosomal protein S8 [Candidatus Saccharibacteria bacterium]
MSLQSTDPIADLLTRIRNAISVGKNEVRVPTSKMKLAVAQQLVKDGYLVSASNEKSSPRDTLVVKIAEEGANPAITEINRLSKPGRRVYAKSSEIPVVMSGRGVVVVSTSSGIMNGREAKKQHLGGELICQVY